MWTKSDKHQVFALLWVIFGYSVTPGVLSIAGAIFGVTHACFFFYHALKEKKLERAAN